MKGRILFLLLCLLSTNLLFSQTHSVTGIVNDQQSKNPLPGATVQLKSTSDSTVSLAATTDSTGQFIFNGLAKDSFRLYIFLKDLTQLPEGSVNTTDITIHINLTAATSSELATVLVTANISPVTQKGDTVQIIASQYKMNPDAGGEDLVKKMPGIAIENGQVKA